MRSGKAEIVTTYSDGRKEVEVWKAVKFTPESNVIGNLRSRPNFRRIAGTRHHECQRYGGEGFKADHGVIAAAHPRTRSEPPGSYSKIYPPKAHGRSKGLSKDPS